MDIQIGRVTLDGYVPENDPFKAIQRVVTDLESTVYDSDAYTTHNYGMTRVRVTIEVIR